MKRNFQTNNRQDCSINIDAKKKIDSRSLGATIPDGFFFDFSDLFPVADRFNKIHETEANINRIRVKYVPQEHDSKFDNKIQVPNYQPFFSCGRHNKYFVYKYNNPPCIPSDSLVTFSRSLNGCTDK